MRAPPRLPPLRRARPQRLQRLLRRLPLAHPVFPTAISPKFASEKAGKARMHTCLDQYRANKATGGNGGLVWIGRKGGGYYSACNKKLKGQ